MVVSGGRKTAGVLWGDDEDDEDDDDGDDDDDDDDDDVVVLGSVFLFDVDVYSIYCFLLKTPHGWGFGKEGLMI